MTFLPKYTITKDILADLTKIEAVKNSFDDQPLSPVLLSSLHKTAKITQTHYSTQIEGNHLSLKQVETTLYSANNKVKEYQGHDEKEVKAYYNAINYMEKYLDSSSPFTENFIQKVHSIIEGSKQNIPYRDAQNAIYDTSDGSLAYLPPETKDVPVMMKDILSKNKLEKDAVDYYVFHQANKFMLNTIRKVCVLPKDKFYVNLEQTGNTVSSTVLIALKQCLDSGAIHKGMNVMVSGFGVGLSWGGTILKF